MLRSLGRTRLPRPPYGPTAGMLQGLQLLQKANVARVDEELLKNHGVAPGNEYKVIGALRYLGVIDEAGRPTDRSRGLRTRGPAFTAALQEMVHLAYAPVLGGLDLRTATRDELYNAFVTRADLGPEMAQKATRFLLGLCALAGIEVSPALGGAPRPRAAATSVRAQRASSPARARQAAAPPPPQETSPLRTGAGVFDVAGTASRVAEAMPALAPVATAPMPQGVPLILAITPQTAELSEDELAKLFRKLFAAMRRAQTEAS
jgi:hypothetical protein